MPRKEQVGLHCFTNATLLKYHAVYIQLPSK